MPKTFWCPTCKEFPDEIVEHYTTVVEVRKWFDEGSIYELTESDFGEIASVSCHACNSILKTVV